MFCHQCGKKLRANARFCFNCGTPVRMSSGQSESAAPPKQADFPPDTVGIILQELAPQTKNADPENPKQNVRLQTEDSFQTNPLPSTTDASETDSQPTTADASETDSQPTTADASETDSQPTTADVFETNSRPHIADTVSAPDLVLKKGNVIVSGRQMFLEGRYYSRKAGRKKFKKRKDNTLIPVEAILGVSVEHRKYGGRILLSLLLFACFAAGVYFSADYGYLTYEQWNTPYREKELAALESVMDLIDNSGAEKLLECQSMQEENRSEADDLNAELSELEVQQSHEILAAVYRNDKFDPDTFFNQKIFAAAYKEYLQDLLNVFKGDELLHSWLYNYYETAKMYGGNYFLDTDLWIYSGSGEDQFSSDLDSVDSLTQNQYDLDFYEHMLYTGHIYITAADFMKKVLALPRYTVDSAVFVNAFGGVPEATEMFVLGWSQSHYEEFWLYGADYYNVDTPIWLDYGQTSKNFDLNWNGLVNETAYYNAYREFMGKIAPDLPCYDMAVYHADDRAFGGMGFCLSGTEASVSDIMASYAENHPEFIAEIKESGMYNDSLATSVDEDINEITRQLEALEQEYEDLEKQITTLEHTLADADIYRGRYQALLSDIGEHATRLFYRLLFLCGALLFCILAAFVCLCKFIGLLKRPGHLFLIKGQDMDYAFNTRHCPIEQIAALQDRLAK